MKGLMASIIALAITLSLLPLGAILLFTIDGQDCDITPWCDGGPLPGWLGYIAFALWVFAIVGTAVVHYRVKKRIKNVQ